MRVTLPLAAVFIAISGALAAADQTAGIVARHGKIYETKKAGLDTQGFIDIENSQAVADTLTGVQCPIAGNSSLVGPDDKEIENLQIAAGKNLILSAGGPHVLLQSTHFSIEEGGAIPCSLTFQNAGTVSVYLYPIPAP